MALPSTTWTDESLPLVETFIVDASGNFLVDASGNYIVIAGTGWTGETLPTTSWSDD